MDNKKIQIITVVSLFSGMILIFILVVLVASDFDLNPSYKDRLKNEEIIGILKKVKKSYHSQWEISIVEKSNKIKHKYLVYINDRFIDFIKSGDSIYSESGWDTIFVYRNNKKFKFYKYGKELLED